MRTLMIIGSLAMIAAGIFCLANGSAAFISIAFIVGLVFAIMGAVEVLMGTRADFAYFGRGVTILNDGICMIILGVVILAGQITDDTTASMLMALWTIIEAVLSIGRNTFMLRHNTTEENSNLSIMVAMIITSMYIFFNSRLFNISAAILIGATLVLLGLNRFVISFEIRYTKPGFLTVNEEKLNSAIDEEKKALAKAKEGIREQKAAQIRIEKIREDMAQEQAIIDEAKLRKHSAENEKRYRG